jgi:hypothetical protein
LGKAGLSATLNPPKVVHIATSGQFTGAFRLAYQPPANSIFLSEQIIRQQTASSTFLSEQINTNH